MAKPLVNKDNRVQNTQLAQWLGTNQDRWLSYMLNNNFQSVLDYIHARPDINMELDANHDGQISKEEVYKDIITYFKGNAFHEFFADLKKSFVHNDHAPAKWNLLKAQ